MVNKKFRVGLFMLPLLTQGGGAEKYFIELARNLNERGFQADVVTMNENFFRYFARFLHIFTRGNFFGKINLAGRESEAEIRKNLGQARWIKSNLKNLKKLLAEYDIIYSKNEIIDLFLLKVKGYENLPPIVVGMHTPPIYPKTKSLHSKIHNFIYASIFYKWLLKGSVSIHASNKFTKDMIEQKFKAESHLIPYPFSMKKIENLARNNSSAIFFDKKKINIIFSGRLGEQKGIDILIDLIAEISRDKKMGEKIILNIFGSGDGAYENEIASLAEKYCFIRYFGHIENKYIPDILSRQNLMVAPSRWETLPYSILEAQSVGIPVIAFDIPGPNDIIEDGKTGLLARSKKDFSEKMEKVIQEKISFEKEYIIENMKKRFDPEKIYTEIIKMFEKAICRN